jgi:hypothetical protein
MKLHAATAKNFASSDQPFERLSLAVEYLATHGGGIGERALDAYRNHVEAINPTSSANASGRSSRTYRESSAKLPLRTRKRSRRARGRKIAMLLWKIFAEVEDDRIEDRCGR